MTKHFNLSGTDANSGMLDPEDPRIPETVRSHFNDYDGEVAKIVPVFGVSRHEWWLFDDEDNLLDVINLKP